jgi:hypothetical protein
LITDIIYYFFPQQLSSNLELLKECPKNEYVVGEMIREGANTDKFILFETTLVLLSRLVETGNLVPAQLKDLIPQSWKIFTALRQKGKNEALAKFHSRTSAALLLLNEIDIDAEQDTWDNHQKSELMKLMVLETIVILIREGKTAEIKKTTANALRILAEREFSIREVEVYFKIFITNFFRNVFNYLFLIDMYLWGYPFINRNDSSSQRDRKGNHIYSLCNLDVK